MPSQRPKPSAPPPRTSVRPSARPAAGAPPPAPAPAPPPVAATDDLPPPFATLGRQASYAMMLFAALLAISLFFFFLGHSEDPWTFASIVSLVSLLAAGVDAWLVWKDPSKLHLQIGLGAIAFSVLRVGSPMGWTVATIMVLTITALLVVPVGRAYLAIARP